MQSFPPLKSCILDAATGVADMPDYRLYCLDGANKISRAEWIDAKSDDDAIMIARSHEKSVNCELWLRSRLVARIPAFQSTA
jgi:hypothetical protein